MKLVIPLHFLSWKKDSKRCCDTTTSESIHTGDASSLMNVRNDNFHGIHDKWLLETLLRSTSLRNTAIEVVASLFPTQETDRNKIYFQTKKQSIFLLNDDILIK